MSITHSTTDGVVVRVRDWFRDLVDDDSGERSVNGGATAQEADGVDQLRAEGRDGEADVLEVVEENGGRVPQQEIVDRLECSESTVSRRLREMERGGLLVRFSRGREKVVYLPEVVPDEALDRANARAQPAANAD